jgi:hypothetical protein
MVKEAGTQLFKVRNALCVLKDYLSKLTFFKEKSGDEK